MKAFTFLLAWAVGSSKSSPGGYTLSQSYVGEDFFSKWTFFQQKDPSRGAVHYVGSEEASARNLVQASANQVFIGADSKTVEPISMGRGSVRIESLDVFNSGLFVIALDHVPTGCGAWPAFWLYGEDQNHIWPEWGEYDIIEGVHTASHVMTTLHTNAHCDQSNVNAGKDFTRSWTTGTKGNAADSCNVDAPDQWHNQGCSQIGPPGSIGEQFNAGGGGVYAAEWDPVARHIRTWFWQGSYVPPDLMNGVPEPDSWGTPYSYFSLAPETCPANHFINMRMVFSLTFCGDLGGPKFADYCPEFEGKTCEEYVVEHPELMTEAYWSIRSLDVYQKQDVPLPQGERKQSRLTFLSSVHDEGARPAHTFPRSVFVLGVLCAALLLVALIVIGRAEVRGNESGGHGGYGLLNVDILGDLWPRRQSASAEQQAWERPQLVRGASGQLVHDSSTNHSPVRTGQLVRDNSGNLSPARTGQVVRENSPVRTKQLVRDGSGNLSPTRINVQRLQRPSGSEGKPQQDSTAAPLSPAPPARCCSK